MGKIAFVFPGQGSQEVGMGSDLAANHPAAAEVFREADAILGFPLSEMCFNGPAADLKLTYNTQPAVLTVSVAALRLLEREGIKPDLVAGHSLGEYAALVAAGALAFPQALRLVRWRGELMEAAVPAGQGAMAAILGMETEAVVAACRQARAAGVVEAVNYNGPGQVVIAGEAAAVARAGELARKQGAKRVMPLEVSGPFHSSLLKEAGRRLGEVLAVTAFADPAIPVVANVSGDYVTTAGQVCQALAAQVSSPVLWEQSVVRLAAEGVDTFIEVGPGRVLGGLIKKIARQARVLNVEDGGSLDKTLAILKGDP